jgi:hypothetical protein
MNRSIFIGYDPREFTSFAIARASVERHLTQQIPVFAVILDDLKAAGLYTRPMEWRRSAADRSIMWDVISDAAMSTEHANARFLVPYLARSQSRVGFQPLGEKTPCFVQGSAGWALFMDGDMLARANLARAFESLDPEKAVYCVQHEFCPAPGVKMDGQEQTLYARKNWSSFMIFNCGHRANAALTPEFVNSVPGRDLHRFCWLKDDEIGALDPVWNWLVRYSDKAIDPKVVHFTAGCPDMPGYENDDYADEWRSWRERLARGAQRAA